MHAGFKIMEREVDPLYEISQINTRLARVELEIDNFVGIKKWVISILFIFVVQLMGFVYGYGGMSTQLDTVTENVKIAAKDRFYRTEAVSMELNMRRDMGRLEAEIGRLRSRLDRLDGKVE